MSASTKLTISGNPEFGIELVLMTPYVHYLHKNNQLNKVITCHDMKPFYFFADNVEEKFNHRTHNNNLAGLDRLPNNWLHHNCWSLFNKDYSDCSQDEQIKANGVLDYSKWSPPNYKKYYQDKFIDAPTKFVTILNRFNYEHGRSPTGFIRYGALKNIFTLLKSKGYDIVYHRPINSDFPNDEGEKDTLKDDLHIRDPKSQQTDLELARETTGVFLLKDIINNADCSYNESQLRVFSKSSAFISIAGGVGILGSYFQVPNIIYTTTGKEIREGYFDEQSYYRKLSGAPIYPVIDKEKNIRDRGYNNYLQLITTIDNVINH